MSLPRRVTTTVRFRDDDRAVTVQIGAVLLFATVIIALSLYQATVVPSQNADVEYKHSQSVQNQMTDVRNGLLRSAATGNPQPVSVALGTQYPSRVFLMNPPPSTGTLRTGSYDDDAVVVSNVEATNEETRDFLDGSWTDSTKYLEYEPDYNEYDNAPRLLYETSVLSNYYPGADDGTGIPLSEQVLVNNETRTITLVTLNGSLSTTRASSVTVSPETLSAPYQRVQVRPETSGDPVNVSVPTRLSAGQLENRTALGSHPGVVDVVDVPDEDRVVVEVNWSGQFTLQTARVGVGGDTEDPPPQYLTLIENRSDRVTVEARDRFNNAESGVTVSVNGTNPFSESSKRTDENGRATFEAEDNRSTSAVLEILGGDGERERVNVSVDTTTEAGPGPGGDAGRLVSLGDATAFDGADSGTVPGGLNMTVRNTHGSEVTIRSVTVEPENIDLDGLSDRAAGEGDGQSELYVESLTTSDDRFVDVPLDGNEYTYVSERGLTLWLDETREERTYDTGSGSYETADTLVGDGPVTLSESDEAEVAFAEFFEVTADDATAVNVTGKDFGVAVTYEHDGTSKTDEFVVRAQSPSGAAAGGGGGTSDPSLQSSTISDNSDTSGANSQRQARYDVSYAVSDPDDQFDRVEVEFSSPQDEETVISFQSSDTVSYEGPPGSASNQASDYTVTIRVYDTDGNVADSRTVTDSPDGTDP